MIAAQPQRWDALSIGLHWLMAVLIIVTLSMGFLMDEMANSLSKLQVYALHKSLGISILALAVLRLLWSLWRKRPAPIAGTPAWQRVASKVGHLLLYVLMLAVPISGWLYNSAAGHPLKWFGLFSLPALTEFDRGMRSIALDWHQNLVLALLLVLLVHVSAALWHHYGEQTDVLRRMLPQFKRRH